MIKIIGINKLERWLGKRFNLYITVVFDITGYEIILESLNISPKEFEGEIEIRLLLGQSNIKIIPKRKSVRQWESQYSPVEKFMKSQIKNKEFITDFLEQFLEFLSKENRFEEYKLPLLFMYGEYMK